ncbi:hypothetical protein LSTR_LSTR007434 [Laodelphax striatellus]|uniref:Cuticle protein n=1 Tax=Laodelphax striatellus TaxID=195883 RepID=A0A482X368_LAOST|nr:hypothetical protein LSTR_LSTR007434 [Laodelphax striatellus]
MYKLVVLSALLAFSSAAPSGLHYAAAPAVVHAAPAVVPAVAVSKTVHYAHTPVVTGYTSSVIKPDLGGHLATPYHTVSKTPVIAPARAVDTVVPQVTHVQPEVSVQKVAYDVPVHTPYISEVEVKTPVVKTAPVVAPHPVVVPAPVPVYKAAPAPAVYAAHAPAVYAAPKAAVYAAPHVYAAPAPIVKSYVAAPHVYAAPAPVIKHY